MNQTFARLVLPATLAALFAPLQAGGADGDAKVLAVWAEIDAAWNARDVERFSELYTEDSSFLFVDRRQGLEGRDAIHANFAAQFPRTPPELSHRTTISDTRTITDGVMTADGVVEILQTLPGSDQPELIRTFAIFALMRQVDGEWRIDALRVYRMEAADPG
jgi:uncharacterized protein (TIGR02246 family)